MKMAASDAEKLADVDTLAAVIAHSQIVVAAPRVRLPAGFDEVDIAVLDWIVAEGHRVGRNFAPM
jgi:hypothetical protein